MIRTEGEYVATIDAVLMMVEHAMNAMNADARLSNAKRQLQELARAAKAKRKPSKREIEELQKAAKFLRNIPVSTPDLENKLWDIEDYLGAS